MCTDLKDGESTVKDAWHQRSEKLFLPESGAPCPPFPYVILGVPPSRSIRTLSRVVLLSGTAEPGTCPPPLLHHVCLYSSSLSLSQFQSTDSTLLNMSDEEDYPDLDGYLDGYNRGYRDALRDNYPSDEETDYSQTEGESGESEGEDEDEDQTEPESEEEDVEEQQVEQEEDQWYQVERPHSPATCRSRCKSRCRFPVYGPPEPDADSDAESDDYESDYD